MTIKMISHADLASLVAELIAADTRVIAPVQAKENPAATDYKQIQRFEDATLGFLPRRSTERVSAPANRSAVAIPAAQGRCEVGGSSSCSAEAGDPRRQAL